MECGKWGTLEEKIQDKKTASAKGIRITPASPVDFSKLETKKLGRIKTEIGEVDRVLGGGIVPGSLILLSGEPGIGKSTIVVQIAGGIKSKDPILYVSGEESAVQVKERLERLSVDVASIRFISETNVEKIIATAEDLKPALVIVDSIQTAYTSLIDSEAGSISQIRASTTQFLELAKRSNIAFILIGHITKDGVIAGPKSLEHIVDTVIYLEAELRHGYRMLRATKNRYGSVNELGIFTMTDKGFKEVKNPAGVFLETSDEQLSGSVISCVMEGTRPFLIEVQALVTKTVFGYPQRKAAGFDLNRLQILVAVLTKRANINLTNQDVVVNIVGGLKVSDPALDLAICLAIASSLLEQSIDRKTIVLGEVGLGGEIRQAGKMKERLAEVQKLGFEKAIVPAGGFKVGKIKLEEIKNLKEIVKRLIK